MKSTFNPWPYGIIGFFILLFCGITTVLVIAATHQDSVVSENYYEQELKYQDQIDGAARAAKCGARVQLDIPAGQLRVTVPAQQMTQKPAGTIEFSGRRPPLWIASFRWRWGRMEGRRSMYPN